MRKNRRRRGIKALLVGAVLGFSLATACNFNGQAMVDRLR